MMDPKPRKLVRNAAICAECLTLLVSKHRHDFVECPCGNFIDGGLEYCRMGGPKFTDLVSLNKYGDVCPDTTTTAPTATQP